MTKTKAQINQTIKKMREAKCAFPNCGEEQMVMINLPTGKITESGFKVIGEMQMLIPVCRYHMHLTRTGTFGIIEQKKGHKLQGPWDLLRVIEAVIEGYIISGRLTERIEEAEQIKKEAEGWLKDAKNKKPNKKRKK